MKTFPFLLVVLAICVLACNKKDDDNPQPNPEPQRNVSYRVSCSDCYVVYYKADGSEGVEEHVNSNWSYSFVGKKDSTVLVVAMNTASSAQAVGATIFLNGDTLEHAVTYCPISGTVLVDAVLD
jgi:hypothetical protein